MIYRNLEWSMQSTDQANKTRKVCVSLASKNIEDLSFSRSNWNPVNLRPIPDFYPLEKSSRIISLICAINVATRISECLREMSISAEFDNVRGTAFLKSPDYVQMHVHLFQGSSQTVIVEIQRRRGCSVLFHKYSRCILDAAEGRWDVSLFESPSIPDSTLPQKTVIQDKAKKHENVLLALEIAAGLIKKDRLDANILGMESLCLLTDKNKTDWYTSLLASRVVLEGDLDESHFNIKEAVLSLVQKRCLDGIRDDKEHLYFDEKEHIELLHNLSLAVLSNALEVYENKMLSEEKSITDLLTVSKVDNDNDLVSSLIDELKLAASRPHDAFLSARCLKVLLSASTEARNRARGLDVMKVVNKAKEIGSESHALLAKESDNVFTAMMNF